jgi:hypothetical protein
MAEMYIPEQTKSKSLSEQYFDVTKVGTLDILGATFEETMYYNPTNALGRLANQYLGEGTNGTVLNKDEWEKSEYFRPGIDVGNDGIKEGLANLFAERYDKRLNTRIDLNRSRGGLGLMASQFGVGIAGSLLDPLNIASAFIPSIGLARGATLANKIKTAGANIAGRSTGKRFMVGAMDGAIGAAILEPLVLSAAYAEQDKDYSLMDSFLNVAFGSALGGGLHVGFGKLSDRIDKIPPSTRDTAQIAATTQVLNDKNVRVDKLIDDAETTKIASTDKQSNTVTVYDSKGNPRIVEKVSVDEEGIVTIKDVDGTEKVIDQSNVISKSPYDDDFEIKFPGEEGSISLSDIRSDAATKKEIATEVKRLLKKTNEAIDTKKIVAKTTKEKPDLTVLEANKKALEIELSRLNGKVISRPKDPVTGETSKVNAQDANTVEDLVQTQEGAELTPQQLEDQRNSAIIEDKLGRDSAYADKVKEIDETTTDFPETKLEEIEAENESLSLELDDPQIIDALPVVARQYLKELKENISTLKKDQQKAAKYEAATEAGAACVIRGRA